MSDGSVPGRAWLISALATAGSAMDFWAWALLGPLGPRFKDTLQLSSFQGTGVRQALNRPVPAAVSH
ncbi:hypothetical protein [Streptomyces europaeiscabiei]|uniref:hypothetical protein n=1 Tax=Streptomyces europaeiscabiei TaxID=146819 RepID=UPI002E2B50EB|nr:hypothetical protein [Streptomyces europaeiscabiei]